MSGFEIYVHERVNERHPDITEEDARSAFQNMIRYKQRPNGAFVGVGSDSNSRMLEIVYVEDWIDNFVLIYHAQTPPTKKTNKELGFAN